MDSLMRAGLISDLNPFPGPHTNFNIPSVYTEAIVGPYGNSIKQIFQKSGGCYIHILRDETADGERVFQLSCPTPDPDKVNRCKQEIMNVVDCVQKYAQAEGLNMVEHKLVIEYLLKEMK